MSVRFSVRLDCEALTHAALELRAHYGSDEYLVRADGTPPTVMPIGFDAAAHREAIASLAALGFAADDDGVRFVAHDTDAVWLWTERMSDVPEEWDVYVPDSIVDPQGPPIVTKVRPGQIDPEAMRALLRARNTKR